MQSAICKNANTFLEQGLEYWYMKSDFCGGCYHIYARPDTDGWIFNIFSEEAFKSIFGE